MEDLWLLDKIYVDRFKKFKEKGKNEEYLETIVGNLNCIKNIIYLNKE